MNFAAGDNVLARQPGTRDYLKASVYSVNQKSREYVVQFSNGNKITVSASYVKDWSTRPGSPGRPVSPGRPKTPTRKTGRPKSPARPKSPGRKQTSPSSKRPVSPSKRPVSPTKRPVSPSKRPVSPIKRIASPGRKPTGDSEKTRKTSPGRVGTRSKIEKLSRDEKSLTPLDAKVMIEQTVSSSSYFTRGLRSNNNQLSDSDNDEAYSKPVRTRQVRKQSEDEKQTARVSPLNSINGVVERVGIMTRRALRSSQSQEKEQILRYRENLEPDIFKNEFSDTDNEVQFVPNKAPTPAPQPVAPQARYGGIYTKKEFGGTIGTMLLTLLAVSIPILLHLWCTSSTCQYSSYPSIGYLKKVGLAWKSYFDLHVVLCYLGLHFIYALLSIIPFGGPIVDGPLSKYGKLNFRANGLFSFVVVTSIVAGLEYKEMSVIKLIYQKQFAFLICATLHGIILGIVLYIRSFFVPVPSLNVQANTNSRFYNFFLGREITPKIFGIFDVKTLLIRTSSYLTILVLSSYLVRGLGATSLSPLDLSLEKLQINPTLIAICSMQIIFAFLDSFAFEHTLIHTFENQQEGCGLLTSLRYKMKPWVLTLIAKYVLNHNVSQPLWVVALVVILFVLGLTIYRGSNAQKHNFRQNPYNPALAHLDSIPTSIGKKLIVSGYWGTVRHPNYVGHLLITASWFLIAPTSPAALVTLPFGLFFLLHRSSRDNARCQQKYGAAWEKYCERVKYVLIPKVY